jgi:Raf kinase inhibitor-like YbhB/YbcL family protein
VPDEAYLSFDFLLDQGQCQAQNLSVAFEGTLLGLNDFKKTGYGGPCPPIGRHRYFHKLYALDIALDLGGATKSQIERAMQGHVLANAELIGTYQKGDR